MTGKEQASDTDKNVQEVESTPLSASKKPEAGVSLSSLRQRYLDQDLIDQVFHALATIRKQGKVADSVLLAQLKKWQRYPAEQVEAALKVYLDKDYASQGRKEDYLLGIIRNQKSEQQKLDESTGSPLLDAYYARESA